jgi:hypothetical protein
MPQALHQIQWLSFAGDYSGALARLLRSLDELRGSKPVAPKPHRSRGYVFISYAAEDATFVAEVKEFLAGRGYSFWDYLASRRDYQRDYTLELEDRISNAEATLSVVSPDWKKSRTALPELHFSKEIETQCSFSRLGI